MASRFYSGGMQPYLLIVSLLLALAGVAVTVVFVVPACPIWEAEAMRTKPDVALRATSIIACRPTTPLPYRCFLSQSTVARFST